MGKSTATTDVALGPGLDFFEEAKSHLLLVIFAKTRSPYYKLAVNVAAGALHYKCFEVSGEEVHVCGCGKSSPEAARALSLLAYVREWSSTQVFAGGRLIKGHDLYKVEETLRCFQSASACSNPKAHCCEVSHDAFATIRTSRPGGLSININVGGGPELPEVELPRHLIPCRLAFQPRQIHQSHPATWAEQFQSMGVRRLTDWCPFFDADQFGSID